MTGVPWTAAVFLTAGAMTVGADTGIAAMTGKIGGAETGRPVPGVPPPLPFSGFFSVGLPASPPMPIATGVAAPSSPA